MNDELNWKVMSMKFVLPYEGISLIDIDLVGGKNASLGEMITSLASHAINVPSGFIITTDVFRYLCSVYNLFPKIESYLDLLDLKSFSNIAEIGAAIRYLFEVVELPTECAREVENAYHVIEERYGKQCSVAVRSSATVEDLPSASCAGQQETFLNVVGAKKIISLCPRVFASLYSDRALLYRAQHNLTSQYAAISLGIQKMVRSDKASSGVLFTLDPDTGFDEVVVINSVYGLGEALVQGMVTPDEVYVHKTTRKKGHRSLLKKRTAQKLEKLVFSADLEKRIEKKTIENSLQNSFSLTDDEILSLTDMALLLEEHYSKRIERKIALDIEWAKDGVDGKLYIVQARPETVHSQKKESALIFRTYNLIQPLATPMMQGIGIGASVVSGKVRVLSSPHEGGSLQKGEILVADMTDPDWIASFKGVAGIITNRGGRTCHAAIVSRELGIPAVVGCGNATELLKTGDEVTLDCSKGAVASIYKNFIPFNCVENRVGALPSSPVPLMGIIAHPDEAFSYAKLPFAGVGLARLEFIIGATIKIHPLALLYPERVDNEEWKQIDQCSIAFSNKRDFFVSTLAQEVATIAAAFYPKPVTVRFSDFKSNEYRQLLGGRCFEPLEENPMIGFRGASRYYHPLYKEAFAMECEALAKVRNEMGFTNVELMIPFVRTLLEAENILSEMKNNGLERGKNGLRILMMCELPSNVILLEEFCALFDGFSIGSNDLTQTILALDRDSHLLAPLFNERDPAVVSFIFQAIETARRNDKSIGICGEAPSDYFDFARALIERGISSISLHPSRLIPFLQSWAL